jgi:hypothetical protein
MSFEYPGLKKPPELVFTPRRLLGKIPPAMDPFRIFS